MKTLPFLLAFAAMAVLPQIPSRADMTGGVLAQSPDHPSTWVTGADNVHQALRWDSNRNMLVADVKYSTELYADDTHPKQDSDYTLSLPSVRLDSASNKFVANGTTVGTLRHGIFGSEVVLNKDAELDVHRHHGRIFGRIVASTED